MDSSICPFCDLLVPSSELQWHANAHFEDHDDLQQQQQLATDYELAQQIALSPNSPPRSLPSEQAASGLLFESASGDYNYWCGGGTSRDNGEWKIDDKISCLIGLQTRSKFYKVEAGLMTLLRNCLESEAENTRSILSGYVDHFQSIESEDVGWGCGWRNIQMLSSHLLVQRPEAREALFGGSGFVPDIPSLQRWLEMAWERGFDEPGSAQLNHVIYGSKKWIGTTECAALFRSFGLRARVVDFGPKESKSLYLSVPGSSIMSQMRNNNNGSKKKGLKIYGPMDRYLSCDVSQASCSQDENSYFSIIRLDGDRANNGKMVNGNTNKSVAYKVLMDFVWNYFSDKSSIQFAHQRVIISEKTPLYFQHDGHSRTIVGIQIKHERNGIVQYNLLILDPAHRTAALERALKEKVGWQKLIKRGMHTLKKPQYQLCYVDPGIASGEEMEKLKTIDSVFLEL